MSARYPLYDGPIIDAHHHWDLSGGRYPWLTKPETAIPALFCGTASRLYGIVP